MPVKIRLQRTGKKDQALYRLIVKNQRSKRGGQTLMVLGTVNRDIKPPKVVFDKQKFESWVNHGAQISTSVRKLLSL